MDETKLEKLARLSGKATSKALDALGRRGFDIRGKLSAPISRVPRRAPPEKPKIERVMADPESIYNWLRVENSLIGLTLWIWCRIWHPLGGHAGPKRENSLFFPEQGIFCRLTGN